MIDGVVDVVVVDFVVVDFVVVDVGAVDFVVVDVGVSVDLMVEVISFSVVELLVDGTGSDVVVDFVVTASGLVVVSAGGEGVAPDGLMAISEHPTNSSCGPYPNPQTSASQPQLFPEIRTST